MSNMCGRTTIKDLEAMVKRINEATGSPLDAYTKEADGSYTHNKTAYHLDGAYGGWKLARGNQPITRTGYIPKSQLYNEMAAYLAGVEVTQTMGASYEYVKI